MKQRLLLFGAILLAGGLLFFGWRPLKAAPARLARAEVKTAWQLAQSTGSLSYRTELQQITRPLPTLANVGLSNREERIYIEGETDLAEEVMHLKLWAAEGNVLGDSESIEIKVEDGRAMGRTAGQEWEEIDNFTDMFAPNGDPLAFLQAAENITILSEETKIIPALIHGKPGEREISYTRYGFDVNSLIFATHMRDQLQRELIRQGELPVGIGMDLPQVYLDMTSAGEVWISDEGYPLRQVVTLQFPPDNNEQIEAKIKTDFDGWDSANQEQAMADAGVLGQLTSPMLAWSGKNLSQQQIQKSTPGFLILMLMVATGGLALKNRRSPKLYAVIALLFISSTLFSPLLQVEQAEAFFDKQNEEQRERERVQKENEAARELEHEMLGTAFDPLVSPLEQGPRAKLGLAPTQKEWQQLLDFSLTGGEASNTTEDDGTDTDGDTLTDYMEGLLGANPNLPDTDGDGLIDGVEVYEIGSNPIEVDTDGDGLSDGIEVQGYDTGFKRYYLNPLSADTNQDGIPDNVECSTGKNCPDSGGTGGPDFADYDDDGDGVPDSVDLSVTRSVNGRDLNGNLIGYEDFTFKIDRLTPGTTAFVDLQLRPVDSDHLWYAMNVLDWPGNDRSGQIQRIRESTFRDFNANTPNYDPASLPKDANGDMKLVPLLEIEIPYDATTNGYGHLPLLPNAPQFLPAFPFPGETSTDEGVKQENWFDSWLDREELDKLGISVKLKDNDRNMLMYVPLNVVRDPVGDGIVAFSGRAAYWPTSDTFGKAHNARFVWMVRMLADFCDTEDMPFFFIHPYKPELVYYQQDDATDIWCTQAKNWDQSEITVHTYNDEWFLTGMSIREDQGTKVGVIFEDPDGADSDTEKENNLWALSRGLDLSFMDGRVDEYGERDLTIDDIEQRFDRLKNGGVTAEERWNIPAEALRVKTFDFPDQTYLATLPMTLTKQILQENFQNGDLAKDEIATLMFVREEYYRQGNLDNPGSVVAIDDGSVTIDMDPGIIQPQVLSGLQWRPYRYKGIGSWEPYPMIDYWKSMDGMFSDDFSDVPGQELDLSQVGELSAAKLYYLSLFQGTTGVVRIGTHAVQAVPNKGAEDPFIGAALIGVGSALAPQATSASQALINHASKAIQRAEIIKSFNSVDDLTVREKVKASLGGMFKGVKNDIANAFTKQVKVYVVDDYYVNTREIRAGAVAGALASVVTILTTTLNAITQTAGLDSQLTVALDYIQKSISIANNITKVVQAIKTGLQDLVRLAIGLQIKMAARVAGVIGEIVAAVAQFAMLFIGAAVTGVDFGSAAFQRAVATLAVSIVISLIMFAISLIPVVGQVIVAIVALIDAVVLLVCKAIGSSGGICKGLIGNAVAALVNVFYQDYTPVVDLQNKDRLKFSGFQAPLVDISKGYIVGNKIDLSITVRNRLLTLLAKEDALKSNFKYEIQQNGTYTIDGDLKVGGMSYPTWQWVGEGPSGYAWADRTLEKVLPFTYPGINTSLNIQLAEGYAVVTGRCVGVVACSESTEKDTLFLDIFHDLRFDVFPATINGFYSLVEAPSYYGWGAKGGYRLNWSHFPILQDADGDGLRSTYYGGNDPDDSDPDIDNDKLSDYFEILHGSDPKVKDSDGDGLDDYQEFRISSNPNHGDTDGDGLSDKQEVDGWLVPYETEKSHFVSSSPLLPDTDGDSITDWWEFLYKINPHSVAGVGSFLVNMVASNSYFTAPGQEFTYGTDVTNDIRNRLAVGEFWTAFAAATSLPAPQPFELFYPDTRTFTNTLTIDPGITESGRYPLSASAGAVIAGSGQTTMEPAVPESRVLHLGFDEAISTTFFMNDGNSNIPYSICEYCVSGAEGRYKNAVYGRSLIQSNDVLNPGSAVGQQKVEFAFSLWVNPLSGSNTGTLWETDHYKLSTNNGFLTFDFDFLVKSPQIGCESTSHQFTRKLIPNRWNHVAVTFTQRETPIIQQDSRDLVKLKRTDVYLYLDGVLADRWLNAPSWGTFDSACGSYWAKVGGSSSLNDEAVYNKGTSRADYLLDLYRFQSAWFQIKDSRDVIVDADKPSVSLFNEDAYYPPAGAILAIEANDPTSKVEKVEYNLDGGGWLDATQDEEVWLFNLDSLNGGAHSLQMRATDSVGNVSDASVASVKVDSTPPSVGEFDVLESNLLKQNGQNEVHLQGAYIDSESGVTGGSVELLDENLAVIGTTGVWTIDGNQWQADYQLPEQTEGLFTVRLTAVDSVGNFGVYTNTAQVGVDGLAPFADVTQRSTPPPQIFGSSTADGILLHLPFDEPNGADQFADISGFNHDVYCTERTPAFGGNGCPTGGQTGIKNGALFFSGNDYVRVIHTPDLEPGNDLTVAAWVNTSSATSQQIIGKMEGPSSGYAVGFDSTGVKAEFWDSAGIYSSADGSGALALNQWTHVAVTRQAGGHIIVYINGHEIQRVTTTANAIGTTSNSPLYIGVDPYDVFADRFVGLMDEVLLFQRALTAEEIELLAELTPGIQNLTGTVKDAPFSTNPYVSLHFEEGTGSTVFIDGSRDHVAAKCVGVTCPTAGVNGTLGLALEFDGVDDSVEFPAESSLDNYTIQAWVRPDVIPGGQAQSILMQTSANGPYANWSHQLNIDTQGHFIHYLWDTGPKWLAGTTVVQPGQWYHVAGVAEAGGQMRLYVNGQEEGTAINIGTPSQIGDRFLIGAAGADRDAFDGAVDEVSVYNRPLSAREIAEQIDPQYSGVQGVQLRFRGGSDAVYAPQNLPGSPVLRLALDEGPGANQFVDASENQPPATCDFCPYSGEAGAYDSAVDFNGYDQYLRYDSAPQLESATDMTVAAWVKLRELPPEKVKIAGTFDYDLFGLSGIPGYVGYGLLVEGNQIFPAVAGFNGTMIGQGWPGVPQNQWTHLAFTHEIGGDLISYINGQEVGRLPASQDGINPAFAPEFPFTVGSRAEPGNPDKEFTPMTPAGLVDEVIVYDRVLSAEEIAELVNPPLSDDPILGLAFEEQLPAPGAVSFYSDYTHHQQNISCTGNCPTIGNLGQFGNGLSFAGGNEVVVSDRPPFDAGKATWMAWVKGEGTLFSDDAALLRVSIQGNDMTVAKGVCDQNGNCPNTNFVANIGAPGDWKHIAVSLANNRLAIYVNGQEHSQHLLSGATAYETSEYDLHIGNGFSGVIDEFVVYPRTLSKSEIAWLADPELWRAATMNNGGGQFASWSYDLPGDLEGTYLVDLRASDAYGNINQIPAVWAGQIDTAAPRVSVNAAVSGPNVTINYLEVADFNLLPINANFKPLTLSAGQLIPGSQDGVWQARLYGKSAPNQLTSLVAASPIVTTRPAGDQFSVCDAFDNCTPVNVGVSGDQPLDLQIAGPEVSLATPVIFNSLDPISFDVYAASGNFLKDLSVTIDGGLIHTSNWPASTITETVITTTAWIPPAEGDYVVGASLVDWNGGTAESPTTTIRVDATPPTITLVTNQVTSLNYDEVAGTILITGNSGDNLGLSKLEVRIDSRPWTQVNLPAGTAWSAEVLSGLDMPPNGFNMSLSARATDATGLVSTITNDVFAEATLPSVFDLTLAAGAVISPGATIHDVLSPTLTISWTASSDSSGISQYKAGWTDSPNLTEAQMASLTPYGPGERAHPETLADGQRLYAHVVAEDANGNRRISSAVAPLYIDYATTPNFIMMNEFGQPYQGWQENSCTLVGADYRLDKAAPGPDEETQPQFLHTSWDDQGLRLNWTGADWSTDGDLFIYLDSQPGGSIRAYNPYSTTASNTAIILPVRPDTTGLAARQLSSRSAAILATTPDQMAADFLVWVQHDSRTVTETVTLDDQPTVVTSTQNTLATLLTWNESSGQWEMNDGEWQYYYGTESGQPASDIYLPFDTLNISDPQATSLALVALASEEDALRLWATIPARNAVDSDQVIESSYNGFHTFALTQRLEWPSLGAGVCPNVLIPPAAPDKIDGIVAEAQQYYGADVIANLSADPVGTAYSVLSDGYFFIMDNLSQFQNLVDWDAELAALCALNPESSECERPITGNSNLDFDPGQELDDQLDVDHPPLGDGDVISYSLQLTNQGIGPATGIVADVVTWGPVRLPAGIYQSDQVNGEFWEWDNLEIIIGDLAPGESTTIQFEGLVDIGFDPNNHDGLATINMTVYDDTGSFYENVIDWLYLDHPVDDSPPAYFELQSPKSRLIGPGTNILKGFVLDESAVPSVDLLVSPPLEPAFELNCADPTPEDGLWSCLLNPGSASEGDVFNIKGKATDSHGLESGWSSDYNVEYDLIFDKTGPTVSLSDETSGEFADGIISPDETQLSGRIEDNHLPASVEVCQVTNDGNLCEEATLELDPGSFEQWVVTYDDEPEAPLPIGASTACGGGNEILRNFSVAESFVIADVDVGLNLDHMYRHDIEAYLTSPEGTEVTLIHTNSEANNYDLLLNDATRLVVDDDQSSHDTSAPYYENEDSPYGYLSTFNGENSAGAWTLRICDKYPNEDDGAYNRSQLILRAKNVPENVGGSWTYLLNLPDGDLAGEHQLEIRGQDSVGNWSAPPLTLTYQVDTQPPVINVTQAVPTATAAFAGAPTRIMTGTVSDSSGIASLAATFVMANGDVISGQVNLLGNDWTLDILPPAVGVYSFWINAEDTAGNSSWQGLFGVEIFIDQSFVFLPLVQVSGPVADVPPPVEGLIFRQTVNGR